MEITTLYVDMDILYIFIIIRDDDDDGGGEDDDGGDHGVGADYDNDDRENERVVVV